jgi:putative acetyltransferase
MIRKHLDSDLETILDIWDQSSSLAHPFLDSVFVEKVRHDMRNMYVPDSETWVYEENNSVTGFISMLENEIAGLFVYPNHHSKGIGTQLVNYIREFYDDLEVEVFEQNIIGRAFYDKYGFKLMRSFIHEPSNHKVMRLNMKY